MCYVERSDIKSGPGKSYYCEVEKFSNIYGMKLVLGRSYGHKLVKKFLCELVWWDGVVQFDSVRGGGFIWGYVSKVVK